MTIPDPDTIRPKLENAGLEEVKKKLLVGAFAKNKIPIIEEWIKQKEELLENSNEAPVADTKNSFKEGETLLEGYIRKSKNHPVISIILFIGVATIAFSNFTDAFDKLINRFSYNDDYISSKDLPGDTGWILVGDIDTNNKSYVRGPFFEVVKSNYKETNLLPRKGEFIKLLSERNVIIADYKTSGLSKEFQPPWKENILEDDDYTGFKLRKGVIAEVRDVSLGAFPNHPAVVWVRIGLPPS